MLNCDDRVIRYIPEKRLNNNENIIAIISNFEFSSIIIFKCLNIKEEFVEIISNSSMNTNNCILDPKIGIEFNQLISFNISILHIQGLFKNGVELK